MANPIATLDAVRLRLRVSGWHWQCTSVCLFVCLSCFVSMLSCVVFSLCLDLCLSPVVFVFLFVICFVFVCHMFCLHMFLSHVLISPHVRGGTVSNGRFALFLFVTCFLFDLALRLIFHGCLNVLKCIAWLSLIACACFCWVHFHGFVNSCDLGSFLLCWDVCLGWSWGVGCNMFCLSRMFFCCHACFLLLSRFTSDRMFTHDLFIVTFRK